MFDKNDIAVVVRSAGERTTAACAVLLKEIFPHESVTILESAPFSKAIADSFEIGRSKKKNWLFCIDADVLVSADGINRLLEKATQTDVNVFEIQGLVFDKFFSVLRPAGNHLYRTGFTEKAMSMIPAEGISLRPESDMLNEMATAGNPWVQCDSIVGIHDFEQFNADVFRKCFLQAHKHKRILFELEKLWLEKARTDFDFKIALWASLSGKLHADTVLVDKRFMALENQKVLHILGIDEKPAFTTTDGIADYVNGVLDLHVSKIDQEVQHKIFPRHRWNRIKGVHQARSQSRWVDKVLGKLGLLNKAGGKYPEL